MPILSLNRPILAICHLPERSTISTPTSQCQNKKKAASVSQPIQAPPPPLLHSHIHYSLIHFLSWTSIWLLPDNIIIFCSSSCGVLFMTHGECNKAHKQSSRAVARAAILNLFRAQSSRRTHILILLVIVISFVHTYILIS
jgi:hypothetical protein